MRAEQAVISLISTTHIVTTTTAACIHPHMYLRNTVFLVHHITSMHCTTVNIVTLYCHVYTCTYCSTVLHTCVLYIHMMYGTASEPINFMWHNTLHSVQDVSHTNTTFQHLLIHNYHSTLLSKGMHGTQ